MDEVTASYFYIFAGLSMIMGVFISFNDVLARRLSVVTLVPFVLTFILMIVQRRIFSDSLGYQGFFHSIQEPGLSPFEIGFEIYTIVFARFANWSVYLASFPIILLSSSLALYTTIRAKTYYQAAAFVLLCWPFFWAYSATGFRQGLAISFGYMAIIALMHRRYFIFSGAIFGATLFHSSALIIAVASIAHWSRLKTIWLLAVWILSIPLSGIINLGNIFNQILPFVDWPSQYSHYFSDSYGLDYQTGLRLDFILFSSIPLAAFFLRTPKGLNNEGHLQTLLKIYLILNAIGNIFSSIPYSDRVYSYSWLVAPVLLASMWEEIPLSFRILIVAILLVLVSTYSRQWLGV